MADEIKPEPTGSDASVPPTAPLPATPADPPQEPPTVATPVAGDLGAAAVASGSSAPTTWDKIDRGPQAKPWRVLSIVLLVLGCVLAPIGVTAAWAKNLVVDQEAYLEAVSPLITDPAIISAAEARLVTGIDNAITSLSLADKIGDELQSLGLPPKLATLATTYLATLRTDLTNAITQMVNELFESPKLATIWDNANTALHTKFVNIMQGEPGKAETLNIDLSAAVTEIKTKLEASGMSWAAQIPDVPVLINVTGNANVQQVAGYYDLLVALGSWLPIVVLLLLLVSIVIAPSRLGGLSKAAGWLAVSMVVFTVVMILGRNWLISKAPLQPEVTQAFTRDLTVNLQTTIRVILICSAVISIVAWLFGRSRSAVSLRREVGSAVSSIQDSRWNLAVRAAGAIAALMLVLILLTMENPTVLWAIVLALLAGLCAVVAISPQRPKDDADPDGADPDGADLHGDAVQPAGVSG